MTSPILRPVLHESIGSIRVPSDPSRLQQQQASSNCRSKAVAVLLRPSVKHSTVDTPIHVKVATGKGKQKNIACTSATHNLRESSSKDYLHRIQKLQQKCGWSVTGLFRAVVTLSVISPFHCSATISTHANLFGRYGGLLRVLQHNSKFMNHNF